MTQASYDSGLNSDRDKVRFLTGDTRTPDAVLDDGEIDWLLSVEPNVWFAAAEAISQIVKKTSSSEEGRLAGETFRWNGSSESIREEIKRLRERGAEELAPKPKAFRVL